MTVLRITEISDAGKRADAGRAEPAPRAAVKAKAPRTEAKAEPQPKTESEAEPPPKTKAAPKRNAAPKSEAPTAEGVDKGAAPKAPPTKRTSRARAKPPGDNLLPPPSFARI